MSRWSHRLLIKAIGFVVFAALPWQYAEAGSPFRFFRELFENTAKHADDAAKHIDDVFIPPRPEDAAAKATQTAVRAASRQRRGESKQDEDAWGYQEWCGTGAGICLLAVAYLVLAPRVLPRAKDL